MRDGENYKRKNIYKAEEHYFRKISTTKALILNFERKEKKDQFFFELKGKMLPKIHNLFDDFFSVNTYPNTQRFFLWLAQLR